MKSAFNLNQQNSEIDSKLIVALERMSEAFRVLLWSRSKELSLSPIQIQILIFLKFHSPTICNVTSLASEFNLTKATISDSIKVLFQKDLVNKAYDPNDSRSFTLGLTKDGEKIVQQTADFTRDLETPLSSIPVKNKIAMLQGLSELIFELNRSGVITVQRMCKLCANYSFEKKTHYCKLLETKLAEEELRLDCPEFQAS